jgi:hypothetical protein
MLCVDHKIFLRGKRRGLGVWLRGKRGGFGVWLRGKRRGFNYKKLIVIMIVCRCSCAGPVCANSCHTREVT